QAGELLRTRQTHGVRYVASVEREVLIPGASAGDTEHGIVLGGSRARVDHYAAHNLTHVRSLGFNQRRGFRHADGLVGLSQLQFEIKRQDLGNLNRNGAANEPLESVTLDLPLDRK